MIDELRKNIETETNILREIAHYSALLEKAGATERALMAASLSSLQASMKLVNSSLPQILQSISVAQPLGGMGETKLERIQLRLAGGEVNVVLRKEDKERLLQELRMSEEALMKIKKARTEEHEEYKELQRSRGYVKFSNRFFRQSSEKLIARYGFRPLALNIQKANYDMLLVSYVSMMLMTSALAIFAGMGIALMFALVSFSSDTFMFELVQEGIGMRLVMMLWLPVVLPPAVFWFLYIYPGTERSSLEKRIDQELPFAVIHMSAISGAGIEPSNIFKIIALSREYPYLRKEVRKVLNQINLYGYDLVTALNNVARATPSMKLSELFTGLSTTIHSGGSLSGFFEKRSETLLLGYRLEREKFTKIAETFMDIYITIAIAAPMILLLILMMLSISRFDIGLSAQQLTLVIIGSIGLVNVFFLTMLHLKQPTY